MTVDMDEISGQGKQMFMVTAMGTAVRACRTLPASPRKTNSEMGAATLTADEVKSAERRQRLMTCLASGTLKFDASMWATLMDERVAAAIPFMVRAYVRDCDAIETNPSEFKRQVVAFLERLEPREAAAELYKFLDVDERSAEAVAPIITELKLRDLAEIRQRLEGQPEHRRRALELLAAEQQSFELQDVDHLRAIAALCADDRFPRVAKLIPGKQGLFGKNDEMECGCGKKRGAEQTHCWADYCRRDVYGFRADGMTPVKARQMCEALAETLQFGFAERMKS